VLLNASEFADSELQDSEIQEMQEMQHSMAMHSQSKENRMADSNLAVAAPAPRAQAVTVSVRYEEHFALWLRQSKALWAQQQLTKRRYRKKKRARTANVDDSDSDDGGASGRDSKRRKVAGHGADGYFRLQQRLDELYSNCWQIVQVVALEHPGKFALWIYVNGRLRRVRMVVPRPFFVNVHRLESFPKLQRSGKLVAMKLPRNRPLLNLLRIELKEHDFVEQAKQIGMFLTHPDIEGVYETNVPLLFRAISAIGCCAAVSPLTKMQNAHSTMGFALDDLEFRSTAQQQYLAHSKFDMIRHPGNDDGGERRVSRESIKYMFFYHSTANNANTNNDVRSVFAFVYQRKHQRLHEYHCRIIAVNKHKKHRLELPDLQHRARELIAHFDLDHHRDVVLLVKESEVKSIGRAYAEANKFLDEYNLLLNGPTILMAQTAATPHDIHSKMPVIHDHFPMVPLLFNKMDNRYPPLQWFRFATLKMIEGWIVVPNLLEQKKGFARYSHIPIGNMPHDVWSYTSDVFFSRLLADHKHLWWISDGSRPDLGGLEEDENLFDDEHSNPVMNNRGAFHTFCIELRLNHLATNTVLQSEHIQTIELGLGGDAGAGDMALTDKKMDGERKENFVKSNIRIDDTSACLASFKILKKLISNWMQDVGASSYNEYADRLLMEFYRWLRTPSSLFYDPLLHRMVHRLMKKVLMQLVAQLKRFGAVVIYASFDRIVIETKKRQFGDAVAYIDSCLSSIGKQDLFEWLTVTPSHFWECLLWHDHANFAGFIFTEKERPSDAVLAPEDALKMEHYQRELELRWNIASFFAVVRRGPIRRRGGWLFDRGPQRIPTIAGPRGARRRRRRRYFRSATTPKKGGGGGSPSQRGQTQKKKGRFQGRSGRLRRRRHRYRCPQRRRPRFSERRRRRRRWPTIEGHGRRRRRRRHPVRGREGRARGSVGVGGGSPVRGVQKEFGLRPHRADGVPVRPPNQSQTASGHFAGRQCGGGGVPRSPRIASSAPRPGAGVREISVFGAGARLRSHGADRHFEEEPDADGGGRRIQRGVKVRRSVQYLRAPRRQLLSM